MGSPTGWGRGSRRGIRAARGWDHVHARVRTIHRAANRPHRPANPSHGAVNPSHGAVNPSRSLANPSHRAANPSHGGVNPSHKAANPSHTSVNPSRKAMNPSGRGRRSLSEFLCSRLADAPFRRPGGEGGRSVGGTVATPRVRAARARGVRVAVSGVACCRGALRGGLRAIPRRMQGRQPMMKSEALHRAGVIGAGRRCARP